MANKVISFEIGAQMTKICVSSYKQKKPRIYKTLVVPTPYDCVEDGYIKDVNTLAMAIGKKLREAKISVSHAVFTISSTKIVNREVVIPLVKEKKIAEIISANAEDYFPIDVKDYNVTYLMMEKINTKEVKNYRLLVLAVHNNLLMTYYELAERLKLKIDSIDYIGNSVFQIFQGQVVQGTNIVVQMNEQNTMVNVMQKKVLELQRIIPYGYDATINTMLDNPNYKLTKAEDAFQRLKENVLIRSHFSHGNQGNDQEPGDYDELTQALQPLVNNILRVIDYYTSKKPDVHIQTVYLTGMGAKLKGIDQLVSNELGIEAKVIETFHGITFTRPIKTLDYSQSDFLACAGATIAPVGMRPVKYAIRETHKNNLVSVVTIVSLVVLTSVLLWFLSDQQVKEAEAEKARLSAQIASMESIDIIYTENQKISVELNTIQGLEQICYSNNEILVPLITELEQKLPSTVIVHSMTAGETGIVLNVTANSKETAAMTMMQLKTIPYITNVTTTGISDQKNEAGMSVVSFSIMAAYAAPEQSKEEVQQKNE